MSKRLAIIGAGGHGRVVADAANAAGWSNIIFFDERAPELLQSGPWQVQGRLDDYLQHAPEFDAVAVAIGQNSTRLALHQRLIEARLPVVTIVHPHSCVSARATVGPGSMFAAGSILNIGAELGASVIVNTGASIDHDCDIGDGVHVSPGARLAGGVTVGALTWIGIGSSIREGVRIGSKCVIGAGATVVSDIPDGVTAFGNPAKVRTSPC